ncbi:16310_t:CDS:1, partial [Racocetra persica]
MGSPEISFEDELSNSPPYPLTLKFNELIAPSKTSRTTRRHEKNPDSLPPPRPQNAFFLFRRDFNEKLKQRGIKLKFEEFSRLAGKEWRKQPQK